MFNPQDTFPYIGLRPFSEEDSIYFKGRDEQILQLTALLEANKFLMVTGASGDGKSSLVYAGLVPNARAGFFKARYTNWIVADFRPERSPLRNLSKSISRNLRIRNEESVEVELKRGFSSLVELYMSSSLYVDEQSTEWKNADDDHRDGLLRNAGNLLIVADQFEEFFTNPENYYRNAPSPDSQLVINLLLETARISLDKNLPIYVLCTMRSDYIGQCAAFRGLPEFIGFSQFFVPRLKRKEMVQVIRAPAYLHGDRISDRLVERVVYDLGEGIDQLPVLEHAMNEVWIQSKQGFDEMDLIHYAMAGGMSAQDLPLEERDAFETWFNSLPSRLKEAYQNPSLSQIIDTHANKLFLTAADYYNKIHKKKISAADAQQIIKVAFTCLTKMDDGRAVRNRMNLQEITDILSAPEFTYEVVNDVLNIFREPGNTFLRPYITDDPGSRKLSPETVLDITHESLIRNWGLLMSWAKEEYEHLKAYEDFKKQLDRWLGSRKSRGFLLPIGPLTFFENWHSKLSPNKYWINRYLDPSIAREVRISEGTQIIEDSNEFLIRSAKKVRVTRFFVKHGAAKIAAVIGIFFMLGLCSFYYLDAKRKENGNVIKRILSEGKGLMVNKGVADVWRTNFFIISEFLKPGSFKEIMSGMKDEEKATAIADMQLELIWANYNADPPIRRQSLYYLDSIIRAVPLRKQDPASLMRNLKALDLLVTPSLVFLYSHDDDSLKNILERSLKDIGRIVRLSLTQNLKSSSLNIEAINSGLEYALNYKILKEEDIKEILTYISPFEGKREQFYKYFPNGKFLAYASNVYFGGDKINNNGGYQQLAYLYAALGDGQKVKMCADTILRGHSEYSKFTTNIFNIANYFITYGKEKNLNDLVSWYSDKENMTKTEFYERWLNRTILDNAVFGTKMAGGNFNANLEFSDISIIQKIFDLYYDAIIEQCKNQDDLDFNLALYYKHRGTLLSKIYQEKKFVLKPVEMDSLFEKAIEHYSKVSHSYLEQFTKISISKLYGGQVQQKIKRRYLFLYPDHFQKVNNREWPAMYFTDKYFTFLLRKGYFSELYKTSADLNQINKWLSNYYMGRSASDVLNFSVHIQEPVLLKIDSLLSSNPSAIGLNNNVVRLLLIDYYIDNQQYDHIEQFYKKLQIEKLMDNLKENIITQNDYYYLINRLAGHLATEGRIDEVSRIASKFPNPVNRIDTYSIAARELLAGNSNQQYKAFILLDSASCELDRIKDFNVTFDPNSGFNDPRKALVLSLSWIGGQEIHKLAGKYVEQISMTRQNDVIARWIEGTVGTGQYYLAYSSIPEFSSSSARVNYFNRILLQEAVRRPMDKEWKAALWRRMETYRWEFLSYEIDYF